MTDHEPVAQMLNSMLSEMDVIVQLALDPEAHDEVAAEERTLGCILTRTQLVLDFIKIQRQANRRRRVV
jgi:hypothetical protein